MKFFVILLLLLSPAFIVGQHGHKAKIMPAQSAPETGLGDIHHPVSTRNKMAQKFFDGGLASLYGFNHEDAIRSFKKAASLDPKLAMAYWGVALASGSNYNMQADTPQLTEAYQNLQKAVALKSNANDHERAYIDALSKRYSADPNTDRQKLANDYKAAMGELVKRFPDDLDAATLYAESMMNLRPWQLWSPDGKPAPGTEEIIAVLESVLRRNPNHTGANHYYIHAVEASPNPERAMGSAERLGKIAPSAGHLVHMPAHIYIRSGDYAKAAKSNADAIVADRKYIQKYGGNSTYPMVYYNHNIHFLASAHAMNGRYSDAIKTARDLEASIKPHLDAMPMLEMFAPYTTITMVRFRKWDEILRQPEPRGVLMITKSIWHFGRGMAYVGKGQADRAATELEAFREAVKIVPEGTTMGNGTAHGVLKVADNLLAGQVEFARGDRKKGIELMRKAAEAEDAVAYNEPPDWDLPVREWLGAALLINGDSAGAEQVFRDELAKHPRNGRALFGLAECLRRQGKTTSAAMVQREFEKAWENADTTLTAKEIF